VKASGFAKHAGGSSAIEFGITAPVFIMLVVGIMEGGRLLWTQLGLQHGAEMAARCSAVNKTLCGSISAVQEYASQRSLGVNPPTSAFSVETPPCGIQVKANFTYEFISYYFGAPSIALTAQSCVPPRLFPA
jgi:hypothetical protein